MRVRERKKDSERRKREGNKGIGRNEEKCKIGNDIKEKKSNGDLEFTDRKKTTHTHTTIEPETGEVL